MEGSGVPWAETGVDAAAGCAACSDGCGAAASTSAGARESGLNTDADMVFSLRVAEQACCGAGVLRSRKLEKALAGTKTAVMANPDGRWCSDCAGRGSAARGVHHQITTFLSSPRTIASPALQSKASANAGMFDGAPTDRQPARARSVVCMGLSRSYGGPWRRPTAPPPRQTLRARTSRRL